MVVGCGGRAGWLGAVVLALAVLGCEGDAATTAEPVRDAQQPAPPIDAAPARPLGDASMDASLPIDAASRDSSVADTGPQLDAANSDAAADAELDAAVPPAPPATLAETGLFAPGSLSELAPEVQPYSPRYVLWADDAEKERWLYLPPDTQIDSSDMDYWSFPVGTKVWKLFSRNGKKLETRLLWKTETGWLRVAYAWNDADTEAVAVPNGQQNVRGTEHDIPNRTACNQCHTGLPDRLLGVSAIQLSHSGAGMTLASLIAAGRLSAAPTAPFALPETTEWNALGYMHANCGHCHNPRSDAYDKVDLDLWLRTAQLSAAADTESYKTTVSQMLTDTASQNTFRVAPGKPAMSGLIERMELRGSEQAMPPIASEQVDVTGTGAVRAWIDDL
jgi:hypothetical protein